MRYRANPVEVEAFVIREISRHWDAGEFTLRLDSGSDVIATKEMTARTTPVVGDYWVIQSDGYVYLNPREVFLRKYSLIEASGPKEAPPNVPNQS